MSTVLSVMPILRSEAAQADRIGRLGWSAGTCIDTARRLLEAGEGKTR